MNELLVQPFFWGDVVAAILALYLLTIAIISVYFLLTEDEVTISFSWLFTLVLLGISSYVLFIFIVLYGEVITSWLSLIF